MGIIDDLKRHSVVADPFGLQALEQSLQRRRIPSARMMVKHQLRLFAASGSEQHPLQEALGNIETYVSHLPELLKAIEHGDRDRALASIDRMLEAEASILSLWTDRLHHSSAGLRQNDPYTRLEYLDLVRLRQELEAAKTPLALDAVAAQVRGHEAAWFTRPIFRAAVLKMLRHLIVQYKRTLRGVLESIERDDMMTAIAGAQALLEQRERMAQAWRRMLPT